MIEHRETRELFTRYWLAKLAVQMKFPELSVDSLDNIAKSFSVEEPVVTASFSSRSKVKFNKTPQKTNPPPTNESPVDRSTWGIRDYVYHVVGSKPLSRQKIYKLVLKEGWDGSKFRNPYKAVFNHFNEYEFITRVGKDSFCKAANSTVRTVRKGRSLQNQGRKEVLTGVRPPIRDAIQTVLGTETLGIEAIMQRLQARDWLPCSKEPRQYISYTLCTNKYLFERVERGIYRAIAPVQQL